MLATCFGRRLFVCVQGWGGGGGKEGYRERVCVCVRAIAVPCSGLGATKSGTVLVFFSPCPLPPPPPPFFFFFFDEFISLVGTGLVYHAFVCGFLNFDICIETTQDLRSFLFWNVVLNLLVYNI